MVRLPHAAIGDLLQWQPPAIATRFEPDTVRAATLSSRISKAVAAALKRCGKSREDVAQLMSAVLEERVSAAMLDAYASEAKSQHKITLERFIALIQVTDCHELIAFIAEPFGLVPVPSKYEDIIELYLLEEHAADISARTLQLKRRHAGARTS